MLLLFLYDIVWLYTTGTVYRRTGEIAIRKIHKIREKNFYFEFWRYVMSKEKMIQEIIRMLKKGSYGKVLLVYNFVRGVYSAVE